MYICTCTCIYTYTCVQTIYFQYSSSFLPIICCAGNIMLINPGKYNCQICNVFKLGKPPRKENLSLNSSYFLTTLEITSCISKAGLV